MTRRDFLTLFGTVSILLPLAKHSPILASLVGSNASPLPQPINVNIIDAECDWLHGMTFWNDSSEVQEVQVWRDTHKIWTCMLPPRKGMKETFGFGQSVQGPVKVVCHKDVAFYLVTSYKGILGVRQGYSMMIEEEA